MRKWMIFYALFLSLVVIGSTGRAQEEEAGEAGDATSELASDEAVEAAADAARQRITPQEKRRLEEAIGKVEEEAKLLDQYEDVPEDFEPHFNRPHPAIQGIGGTSAGATLRRMVQPFTGNEFRDTYIRWHLLNIVRQAPDDDLRESGPLIVRLLQMMPGPLNVERRQERKYVPPEIWQEYQRLLKKMTITRRTGYPPFVRIQRIRPPEVIKHLSGQAKARAEALWERAQELRSQFEVVVDEAAVAFNRRVREMNFIIRQYRGELIYEALRTGDPAMLKLVVNAIGRRASSESIQAFDLMAFMYLAGFDGLLNRYAPELLEEAGNLLERLARRYDDNREFDGDVRNFADYSFHMVQMLKDPGSMEAFEGIERIGIDGP